MLNYIGQYSLPNTPLNSLILNHTPLFTYGIAPTCESFSIIPHRKHCEPFATKPDYLRTILNHTVNLSLFE